MCMSLRHCMHRCSQILLDMYECLEPSLAFNWRGGAVGWYVHAVLLVHRTWVLGSQEFDTSARHVRSE
jgi:hypothetical protein